MKFEALTIKDIAKALGISTSTVSRALRDSYEISADTKKMVLEYAEKNNYHPNPIALSLKERRSRSVGVIVCEIANNLLSSLVQEISQNLAKINELEPCIQVNRQLMHQQDTQQYSVYTCHTATTLYFSDSCGLALF
jgi:LacI family transcriptional regulator